jgi:hypothetical protein
VAIKIKRKPKPVSNRTAKNITKKYYGNEPIIEGTPTEIDLIHAYNWYNSMCDISDGKEWLLEYLRKHNYQKDIITGVNNAPDIRIISTTCWSARLMLNGSELSDQYMDRFNTKVKEIASYGVKEPSQKSTVNVQDRIKKHTDDLICCVEELLDTNPEFSMYEFLTEKQVSQQSATKLHTYYKPCLDEVNSDDIQVKESYGTKLKYWKNIYKKMIDDLDRYTNNKKNVKPRKPRTKKVKSSIDLIKSLQYKKEDPTLKLVSINPQNIIGANCLWVYNVKYKKIGVYHSDNPKGFSVKGTTLLGFDATKSICKTVRKPELQLQEFFGLGKVALKKFMANVKTTETPLTGRINNDTILLKIIT